MAKQTKSPPRGIRNHNPLNIRRSRDKWQGLASPQQDREFFTFVGPEWGIRAAARILIRYQDDHNLTTVRQFINRWAPPVENDTDAYAEAAARAMGLSPDDQIDAHDYRYIRPMVEAMIRHENGQQPYAGAVIDKGLILAGVEPPKKPLAKSQTIQGAQVATLGVTGSALADVAQQASDVQGQLAPLVAYSEWIKLLFLGVALVGIGLTVWARIQQRRRGID